MLGVVHTHHQCRHNSVPADDFLSVEVMLTMLELLLVLGRRFVVCSAAELPREASASLVTRPPTLSPVRRKNCSVRFLVQQEVNIYVVTDSNVSKMYSLAHLVKWVLSHEHDLSYHNLANVARQLYRHKLVNKQEKVVFLGHQIHTRGSGGSC